MHPSALENGKYFFDTYASAFAGQQVKVIEIGAQDVNGSLRSVCPPAFEYVGVDFVEAPGVDVVLDDPYVLPFEDASADIILSSSCLEHSEMFWLVFLEVMRVLKPKGLFFMNVPSNGPFHRYPVDCWRFYPDSGNALITWARRNKINAAMLESYTSAQKEDVYNDFVAVFLKDEEQAGAFPDRIVAHREDFTNGIVPGHDQFLNMEPWPEDNRKLLAVADILLLKRRV
ncbi:MAG TPA: methyltransferase domain-containing protein [Pseudoxanthomonas sp.]